MTRNLAFLIMILAAACAVNPYAKTNKTHKKQLKEYTRSMRQQPDQAEFGHNGFFVGTTNFSVRTPDFVIIHHTAQNSCDETFKTFTTPRAQVSSHYVICREGYVYQMLDDRFRAHHAGVSKWGPVRDMNSASIGIEIDNNGFEPFTDAQIESLLRVLDTLKTKYRIPAANFIGHADIAPKRKVDPNIYFPWKKLAENGFGLWYKDTTDLVVPEHFDPIEAFRFIGYDTRDTLAVIRTFKQKFLQDTILEMSDADIKVLYALKLAYAER